jgi:hypothetical protein
VTKAVACTGNNLIVYSLRQQENRQGKLVESNPSPLLQAANHLVALKVVSGGLCHFPG